MAKLERQLDRFLAGRGSVTAACRKLRGCCLLGVVSDTMYVTTTMRLIFRMTFSLATLALLANAALAQTAAADPEYDLLLKGGHVIDGKNGINAVRDVAMKDGKIAAVAANIAASKALKTVDVKGLYVTPGLVDIHVHVFQGPVRNSYANGDNGLFPDGYCLRNGVTTVADAGSAGWRNFEDFKTRIIDASKTRVLSFLNIVGNGMGNGRIEQNVEDMEVAPTAEMAAKHKGVIIGIKSAHFSGAGWAPYERAVAVGKQVDIPVMIDFGSAARNNRTLNELFEKYLRAGDIYTHVYSGLRQEQDPVTHGPAAALLEGRKKGIFFDVGHGGTSFAWGVAVPLMKAGFLPDSISTDLHRSSAGGGMKDMLNVMDKFLAMGMPLDQVIVKSTWNPAKEIRREDLGHLSVGAVADVAVLRVEKGKFGFVDAITSRMDGTQKLVCELTLRNGKVLFDLNGMSREAWDKLPATNWRGGDIRWDGLRQPPQQQPGQKKQSQ
jgi:dihydroorotase